MRVLDIDRTEAGESEAVSAVAGRHHAIEHVDAAGDRFEKIGGRADAHQIPRPLGRQRRRRLGDDFEHHLLGFADGEAADSVTGKTDLDQRPRARDRAASDRRRPAQCRTARGRAAAPSNARLHRSAQRNDSFMARSISPRSAGSRTHSSSCMAISEPSMICTSMARSGVSSIIAPSMWERKVTPVFGDLAQRRERHHLEAPGIGKDRIRPAHESVQPAKRGDALGGGPQHQMVGVAEQNLGARCANVVMMNALDRRLRADRHESRRMHDAMRGRHLAGARSAVGRGQAE